MFLPIFMLFHLLIVLELLVTDFTSEFKLVTMMPLMFTEIPYACVWVLALVVIVQCFPMSLPIVFLLLCFILWQAKSLLNGNDSSQQLHLGWKIFVCSPHKYSNIGKTVSIVEPNSLISYMSTVSGTAVKYSSGSYFCSSQVRSLSAVILYFQFIYIVNCDECIIHCILLHSLLYLV